MRFHRYGSLGGTNYRKYRTGTFHSAPVNRGIYAFPYGVDDSFLWAWKFRGNDNWEEHEAREKFRQWAKTIHRVFEYNGDIWHHLQTRKILQVSGSWILSTMSDYKKAFKKAYARDLKRSLGIVNEFPGVDFPDKTRYNPYRRNTMVMIAVDHLEVFIEKVK